MDLNDYVDVPTRFAALLAKWPELRIKEHRPEIVTIGDKTFISVTMQAWRTPDDPVPCQATCFEIFPGRTPFTRDSEMMNASTSCLGRLAGLMMSFPKMASLEEVVNRQSATRTPPGLKEPTAGQIGLLKALGHDGQPPASFSEASKLIDGLKASKLTATGEAF